MDFFIKYVFPFLLLIGAVCLSLQEVSAYHRGKKAKVSLKSLKIRLFRRLFGAFMVVLIAVLLFWGTGNLERLQVDNWQFQARFWLFVIGLVFLTMGLAVWDVLDGVKKLEQILDITTKEQMDDVKKYLKKNHTLQKNQ